MGYLIERGLCYLESNIEKAIELNERAIQFNDSFACNNLAGIYILGNGISKNYQKTLELCEKSLIFICSYIFFTRILAYLRYYSYICNIKSCWTIK